MRGFLRRSAIVLTAAICAVTGTSATAFAAPGDPPATSGPFNFIVSPVSQQLEVKPNGSATTTIQVQNKSNSLERVKAEVYTFSAEGEDGTPKLIKPKDSDDFIKWATLSTTQFDAEPNVFTDVKLTINPPKDAAFGYYYAVMFSRASQKIDEKKSNLLGAVASLVLVNVQSPNAKRQVEIAEFSTSSKTTEFLPANFTVRLKNTGNTHVAPRANIFIKKGDKDVALVEVNLSKGQILPKSFRLFESKWDDGSPAYKQKIVNGKPVVDASGKPVMDLSWDKFSASKLRYGKYTAKLVMVYNDGKNDVSSNAELSFWVIPWRIIGVGLIGLVILGAGFWTLLIRPIRQRAKHGHGSSSRR